MSLWRRILVERRAVILPLVVLLLGNVAVYTLVVLPLEHSVSSASEAAFASAADLARARRDDADAKKAQVSTGRADEELKRFYEGVLSTSFPQARDVADFWLDRTARQAGVAKKGSLYEYSLVKDSKLVRVKGKVVLEGPYRNIRKFLYATETAKEFIIIEAVDLAEGTGKTAGTGDAISVTLSLSTYYVSVDPK